MQILKVKTQEDFNNVVSPHGTVLIWPQVNSDHTITLYCKTETGEITRISAIDESGSSGECSGKTPMEFTIDDVSNNVAELEGEYPVVVLRTDSGNLYSVEDGDISWNDNKTYVDLSRYLIYENASQFIGTWTAFYAAGKDGKDGQSGKDGKTGPTGPKGDPGEYSAGEGITLIGDTISVDGSIARKNELPDVSGMVSLEYVNNALNGKTDKPAVKTVSISGNYTADYSEADIQQLTLTGDLILTIANMPHGHAMVIVVDNNSNTLTFDGEEIVDGSYTGTWILVFAWLSTKVILQQKYQEGYLYESN